MSATPPQTPMPVRSTTSWVQILDAVALAGLGVGLLLCLVPWWSMALKVGFFVTLSFTLLHIVTSHLVAARPRGEGGK